MCAIICPVSLAHDVRDMFDRKRASMTQGIVHHKQNLSNKQGDKAFSLFASLNEGSFHTIPLQRQAYLCLLIACLPCPS